MTERHHPRGESQPTNIVGQLLERPEQGEGVREDEHSDRCEQQADDEQNAAPACAAHGPIHLGHVLRIILGTPPRLTTHKASLLLAAKIPPFVSTATLNNIGAVSDIEPPGSVVSSRQTRG